MHCRSIYQVIPVPLHILTAWQWSLAVCYAPLAALSLSVVLPRARSGSQEVTAALLGLSSNKGILEKWERAAGDEQSQVSVNHLLPSLWGHHIHEALWKEPVNSTVWSELIPGMIYMYVCFWSYLPSVFSLFLWISVGSVMSSGTQQWGEGHGAQVSQEVQYLFPGKEWEMKSRFLLHLPLGRAFPQAEVMFSLTQCGS